MSDIFISYASADRVRVKLLVDALEHPGWSVWWDRKIPIGKTWHQTLETELIKARCVIVLWSEASVQSDWVLTEAEEAKQRGILIPARLEKVSIPQSFREMQAADLTDWPGVTPHHEFEELAAAVAKILSRRDAAPVVRKNPQDGLDYVWIPAGSFTMGCSPDDSECFDNEKPSHPVTITEGFWLGQTPVTQQAYLMVTGQNPSYFQGADLPVELVSWDDAQRYCRAAGGRLPTEAEWEYAGRGGSESSRYGVLEDIAWHIGNSSGKTRPVGQKQPNDYGVYDMLGNVWEWTADWYGSYSSGAASDPSGPAQAGKRTLRGGSWNSYQRHVRASSRDGAEPGGGNNNVGFRCVMNDFPSLLKPRQPESSRAAIGVTAPPRTPWLSPLYEAGRAEHVRR